MKKIAIILVVLFIGLWAKAQWEYNYFVIRAGLTNQFLNPAPESVDGLYLNSFEGQLRLEPDTGMFFKYNTGYTAGLDFHFDWQNDWGGIIIGVQYMDYTFSNKFITPGYDYYLIRSFTVRSVSFPLFVKFGYNFFEYQRYLFIGARVNWNFAMDISEEVSWSAKIKTLTVDQGYFKRYNYILMAGFNFLFFNVEFDFMPESFLNKNYTVNVGDARSPYYIKPFASYPDRLFWVTTSLYIPLSPWSSTRSYFIDKLLKLFKFK